VGGTGDNANAGAVWIYNRSGDVWTQHTKLVGTGAIGSASQGFSVAISDDGNTAIVGGLGDNTFIGAAWVFTRTGGVWSQQGSKLVGTGAVLYPQQGCAVSLSADGNTAIVGGFRDNAFAGAAWIFTRNGNVWSQQGSKLVVTDAIGSARLGISVDLSSDGNTAIVGGHTDNANAGAAWIFIRSGSNWTVQRKLTGTGAVGSARFGRSVSISSDGNTTIVGGYEDNALIGAVWVYTRSGSTWSQQGNKLVGTGAVGNAYQGFSVSLSSDGNTALIGGIYDNAFAGATWVFTRSGGVWSQLGNKLVGSGAVGMANQGGAVAIAPGGNTAIVGGTADNTNMGAAWIFSPGTSSVQLAINLEACNETDTIDIDLRKAISPYDLVETQRGLGGQGLVKQFTFYNALSTTNYYLVVRHRNSITTWSKSGGEAFVSGSLSYDFTSAAAQAFGNNMVLVGSDYSFYTGDVQQNGTVDLTDIVAIFNDANAFVSGYVVTDLNCDDIVDLTDLVFANNNSSMFISVVAP
jgi:hypothetical protein